MNFLCAGSITLAYQRRACLLYRLLLWQDFLLGLVVGGLPCFQQLCDLLYKVAHNHKNKKPMDNRVACYLELLSQRRYHQDEVRRCMALRGEAARQEQDFHWEICGLLRIQIRNLRRHMTPEEMRVINNREIPSYVFFTS